MLHVFPHNKCGQVAEFSSFRLFAKTLSINPNSCLTQWGLIIRIRFPFSGDSLAGLWFFIDWSTIWCRINAFEFALRRLIID
jgi:hypothetical protein